MVDVSILQVRVSVTFMLDPDMTLLLPYLAKMGYIVASFKTAPGGSVIITPLMPPNIIAMKGTTRIEYDFNRRTLSIESQNSQDVSSAFKDMWEAFEDLKINIEKALAPCEAVVIALATLSPKFSNNKIETADVLGYNLRMSEATFASEGSDPTSLKWFYIRIIPIYSSFRSSDKENFYRIEIVHRDEKEKILKFIENIEDVLRKLLEMV
jgi:hypothetical protein